MLIEAESSEVWWNANMKKHMHILAVPCTASMQTLRQVEMDGGKSLMENDQQ
jgi:hypothetical protein